MDFLPLLVSAMTPSRKEGATLSLDLNRGIYTVLLPYPGALAATRDHLYIARNLGERTRLEKYDRGGLVWMRRVADCLDTHSVALIDDHIALCSTGTNQVIFLDQDGAERSRWSPDPSAEADSWHLNSLTVSQGRLFATCFGRFREFRGWADHTEGAGLVIEIPSGRVVFQGFTAPHDPRRIEDGWLINDSAGGRTLLVSDAGATREIVAGTGFARGLAVLPQATVIGFSTARTVERHEGCASVWCVDRHTGRLVTSINLPHAEIGHIIVAPVTEVLAAVRREQTSPGPCLLPDSSPIPERDRAGSVVVVGAPRPSVTQAGTLEVAIRLTNQGQAVWSSGGDLPVHVVHRLQTVDAQVLVAEGTRTRLPVPVHPGKSLTFRLAVDLSLCRYLPAANVWISLVQESVAWWEQTSSWKPALLRLPGAELDRLVAPVRREIHERRVQMNSSPGTPKQSNLHRQVAER
jgi:uncharacterized protein (TIGR03032 family)